VSEANLLTIVIGSAKHFFVVSFGRLREVFLRGEAESICPEGTRATSPNLRAGGWGSRVFGYWT